ncbi:CAP domain-containing protein [Sinosporangium siamense]|uniref:SCP domain-containing protein n=1 Tax=Sinosporangium siamense TaxID=1367973 RepID=A0A919RBD0_9ACTN|nr:CAP domain-containing protein [Sinosporangium siamense]GII90805.1 hypothetical protein Ssi02_10360 [Sinosporangium siamense]
MLACLCAVLFLGILIGRLTRGVEAEDNQVYLNNAAPGTPSPSVLMSGRDLRQTPLGRVTRPTPTTAFQRATPTATTAKPRSANTKAPSLGDPDPAQTQGPLVLHTDMPVTPTARPSLEAEVVRLTNIKRRERGCGPLRIDRRLVKSARLHSAEMAAYNMFSHESPDGASPWDRMEKAGYRNGGAENIGRGYTNAREAVQGWMESANHRRNILNCRLVAIGVGVAYGFGGLWWTQDFGYS